MAFSCRAARNLTTGCLAAAWLLCASSTPLAAQALNPINTDATLTTLSFSWNSDGGNYFIALSTDSGFSVQTATGPTTGITKTYTPLTQDGIYYFRVKRSGDPDSAYFPSNQITTYTYAAAPSALDFVPGDFMSDSSSTARVGVTWQVNGNPEWTDYRLEYSTDNLLAGASTLDEQRPPMSPGGLEANTSYYFRVRAVSVDSVQSAPTDIVSTATLAIALPDVTATVYETSTTVSWSKLDSSTQAQRAQGYMLTLSLSKIFVPPLPGWSTADNTLSSTTLTGLDPNTTYYYEVGSLNINGAMNSDGRRDFTTLAAQPQDLQFIGAAGTQTARLGWAALPAAPSSATALGYRLEASSSNFDGGTVLTTTTYNISNSTLTLQDLDPNTTYYFRVGTLNLAGTPNYSTRLSTITLTAPLTQALTSANATQTGITVSLNPPFPSGPQKNSCEGYLLLGSSTAFVAGSAVYSSASYSNLTNSLTLDTLRPNTIYSLRMATLNWDGTPNFIVLPPIRTAMAGQLVLINITGIWESSATIKWTDNLETDGYVLEASTYSYFNSFMLSSSTIDSGATGLTVTGLDRNTAYYFWAGALYNGTTAYTQLNTEPRSTLASTVTLSANFFAGVFHSSVTVSWTPLAVGPQNMTAEAYHLEASTSPDFATVVYTTATSNPSTTNMTVQNLQPNTSYYLRAGTLNWDNVENYSYTPATATLANAPIQTAFTLQTTSQMTLNWESDLRNPPDTLYLVNFSSNSDMVTLPVYSSSTRNSSASFSGLVPNTTYYSEVTAVNRLNVPEGPYTFTAMATLAYIPDFPSFSGIGVSSLTLNWGKGLNPVGDTYYRAEISSSPVFAPPLLSSVTLNTSATFYGLVSDATYYLQVVALNRTGVPTSTQTLGAALTLPATAYILPLADTFSGLMTDGFTMHWAANGNSEHTVYNLIVSTAEDFNTWASSQTVPDRPGLSYTFGDLMVDTTYWAKIQSKGQSGALTGFEATGPVTTLLSESTGALVSNNTTVTLQTSYGLISVFIPYGALRGSSRITISAIKPEDSFAAPDSAVSVLRPTGIGLIINQFPPVLVLNPITIILPYPSDLSSDVDRSKLVLALYDESSRVWVPLPTVSDLAHNKVTAQTWHLSTFQLMEALPAAELGGVRVYPNPYTPSSISNVMHFSNLPPYARVKIYTFLGELVKALNADENGMTYWDGNNTDGQKAASGVYIALLQTQDKKSHKMVKVVLER